MEHSNQIGRDWCYQYLLDHVFTLRPEGYQKEYPIWPGMVGIEIEMFPLDSESLNQSPKILPLLGEQGLQEKLTALLKNNRQWKVETNSDGSMKRVLLGDGDQLTFEPGGQLEYSSRPYPCLDEACKRVKAVQDELSELSALGVSFLQAGSHPWQSADEIGLQMAKPRYQAMNQYFGQLGSFGMRMMRETCTIQVNLDFGDTQEKLAKRYLAANLIAPILTAIFANSPVSTARKNGYLSQRASIWQNLDSGRTGFPELKLIQEALSQKACVDAYLKHVLDANVVFIESLDFMVPPRPISFRKWMEEGYQGVFPGPNDFVTHLSLHFPEVRARGFMELRSIDSQGKAWQLVPACVATGLLYDDQALEGVLNLMIPHLESLEELWKSSVKGLDHVVLRELAVEIMYLAQDGFKRLPPCYQGTGKGKMLGTYAEHFTLKGRTPADDVLDGLKGDTLSSDSLFSIHQHWLELLSK